MTKYFLFFFSALTFIAAIFLYSSITASNNDGPKNPCEGRQWEKPGERLKCYYPDPPIGRWEAAYSEEFAKEHNLPKEKISKDLSPGIDYMEMDVQPYGYGGTGCVVNMLVKKPHDFAMYNMGEPFEWETRFHENRKLAHLLELDEHKKALKSIGTFGMAPRHSEYNPKGGYSIGSRLAFYAEDVLEGYDYFSVIASCYYILSNKPLFPDEFSFAIAKASIWGRYETPYIRSDVPGRPKGKEFYDSRLKINIPKELILTVFEDMPIGGRQ